MEGTIALIKLGGCQFGEQVARAGAAGAKVCCFFFIGDH